MTVVFSAADFFLQAALLAPAALATELPAGLALPAGALHASHGSGLSHAFDSDESIEVWIHVAGQGSGDIKVVRAPRRMTLAGLLQGAALGLEPPVGAKGVGMEASHGALTTALCKCGLVCDGRYVGRMEATLEEAGLQSCSKIEVVPRRRGGSGHGSGQAEGQRSP